MSMNDTSYGRMWKLLGAALAVFVIGLVVALSVAVKQVKVLQQAAEEERKAAQRQIDSLREEVSRYKEALANTVPAPPRNHAQPLPAVTTTAVLASKVKPRAACQDLNEKGNDGLNLFLYSMWVEAPPPVFSRIQSVKYDLNHPTFSQRFYTSKDPSTKFRQSYRGWGCLDSVLVHVHFEETIAEAPPIDFAMCDALGNQPCSAY